MEWVYSPMSDQGSLDSLALITKKEEENDKIGYYFKFFLFWHVQLFSVMNELGLNRMLQEINIS